MLSRVLDELGPELDPRLRATLETLRMATASVDVRLVPSGRAARGSAGARGGRRSGRARAEDLRRLLVGADRGRRQPLVGAARAGSGRRRFVAEQTGGSPIVIYAALVLVLSDEVERAEALLADIRADARARGSIISHLVDLAWGAFLRLRTGELRRGRGRRAALALARRIDANWVEIWLVACLCDALREQGELEAASSADRKGPLERAIGTAAGLHALLARARLRVALGDRDGAISDLWLAGENVIVNNPSFLPWRSALATILAPTDRSRARARRARPCACARARAEPRYRRRAAGPRARDWRRGGHRAAGGVRRAAAQLAGQARAGALAGRAGRCAASGRPAHRGARAVA